MLTCVPESWTNWNFEITSTSADPTRITLERSEDYGTILLGGSEFAVRTLYNQSWGEKGYGY